MKYRRNTTTTIIDMVEELLKITPLEGIGKVDFPEESKELIHNIAQECNKMPIVQQSGKRAQEYAAGVSAEYIYLDMLYKIARAPSRIHMLASAVLLIPIIDQKLSDRSRS